MSDKHGKNYKANLYTKESSVRVETFRFALEGCEVGQDEIFEDQVCQTDNSHQSATDHSIFISGCNNIHK